MATALREILAHFGITVDSAPLEKGDKLVDGFKEKLLGMGKVIAGAFAVDAIVSFGREIINSADEVREAAIALGLIPQHLQELEFAASTAGVATEELRASLAKFNKVAAESAKGKGASEALKRLGVGLKNADGSSKTSGELFEQVGVAIGAIEDPIERAGIASEFFGKSYAKLLPLFAEGEEGIKKLKGEAHELGIVFDDAFLENADEYNDNLARLKGGLRGLFIQAIGPLLPRMVEMTKSMVVAVKSGLAWVKGTRLVQAVITGFTVRGVLALAQAIPRVVAALGGWRLAFATLGRFILRTLAPLLLLEDAIVFFTGGKSAIGQWIDRAFGPGSQQKVRDFFTTAIAEFTRLKDNADAAYVKLGDSNQSWVDRVIAGFALLVGGSKSTFAAINEGWGSILNDMAIAVQQFISDTVARWNAFVGGFKSLQFDKTGLDEALDARKRRRDAYQQQAYDRENQRGRFETPEIAAQRAKNAAAGLGDVRDEDLTPLAKQAADYLKRVTMGGGPGSGPYRLDEEGRYAPGDPAAETRTPYVPGTAYQAFTASPPSAPLPAQAYTDARVDVGGVRVNQQITVPAGTTEEQARELGRGSAKGVRDAVNTRQLQDSLVHTAG